MKQCPCRSKKSFRECCSVYINGQALPATPEALMRSRYTAYSLANINYIMETMKGRAIENYDKEEAQTWAKRVRWLGLDVLNTKTDALKGWVEFIAHYSDQGIKQKIEEVSEFHFEDGRWFYVDGVHSLKSE